MSFRYGLIICAVIAIAGPWIVRALFDATVVRWFLAIVLFSLLCVCAYLFANRFDGHGAAALGFVVVAALTVGAAISGYFASR